MVRKLGGHKQEYKDIEISLEEAELSQKVRSLVDKTSGVLDKMNIHPHERDVLTDLYRGYATNIKPGRQDYKLEKLALAIQEIIKDPEGFVKRIPLKADYLQKQKLVNSFK